MSQAKITKRSDGRYKVNYGPMQFYGKTKAEAIQRRSEFIAGCCEMVTKGFIPAVQMPEPKQEEVLILDYGRKWVQAFRSQCQTRWQNANFRIVDKIADGLGNMPLTDITATDLQCFVNGLSTYSPSHMNKIMNVLNGIFKTAFAESLIKTNPMTLVKRPRVKKCVGHRSLEQWERELVTSTWQEHDFGPAAMVMLCAGLRRGEMLYLDVDRDVDFEKKTLTVRGAVTFKGPNQPSISDGKTENAQRTIPLVKPLEEVLKDRHGLILSKEDGTYCTQVSFAHKYESYITFLETKVNGCHKRWYGKTREHKEIIEDGKELPEWKEVKLRCHDFRVDFCTRAYHASVPLKTLQRWMGHADETMILRIYTKITDEEEAEDSIKFAEYMEKL